MESSRKKQTAHGVSPVRKEKGHYLLLKQQHCNGVQAKMKWYLLFCKQDHVFSYPHGATIKQGINN